MASNLVGNPMTADEAVVFWASGVKFVRLIQWIDDNADVATGDVFTLIINGVTVTCKMQMAAAIMPNSACYIIGPFNPGIPIHSLNLTSITHGACIVFIE